MATKPTPREPSGRTGVAQDGARSPRLPHERDESSDAGRGAPREVVRQAARDGEAGRVDTSRSTEADAAYREQKKGAPVPPHNRSS